MTIISDALITVNTAADAEIQAVAVFSELPEPVIDETEAVPVPEVTAPVAEAAPAEAAPAEAAPAEAAPAEAAPAEAAPVAAEPSLFLGNEPASA